MSVVGQIRPFTAVEAHDRFTRMSGLSRDDDFEQAENRKIDESNWQQPVHTSEYRRGLSDGSLG